MLRTPINNASSFGHALTGSQGTAQCSVASGSCHHPSPRARSARVNTSYYGPADDTSFVTLYQKYSHIDFGRKDKP